MALDLATIPGIDMAVKIGQAVGVVVLIYMIVLISKAVIQMRQAIKIKNIAKNVEEINKKLDILVGKKGKK